MVQDSLIDYINSQMKAGTSRDAIKASLMGAGWQAADVEDTLKKIEGGKTSAAATPAPQTIRMSDLVSAPSTPVSLSSSSSSASPKIMGAKEGKKITPVSISTVTSAPVTTAPRGRGGLIAYIVGGVLIVGLAALAGLLYMQNSSLSAKVTSLGGESAGVTSNLTTLNAQVQALDASNTALTAQVTSLVTENQDLQIGLSFYAIPPSTIATSTALSVTGTISGGGKALYALTTPYGAKIYAVNSKDPKVVAAITPFVGTSTQISGTYVPGSDMMTITGVNGSSTAD